MREKSDVIPPFSFCTLGYRVSHPWPLLLKYTKGSYGALIVVNTWNSDLSRLKKLSRDLINHSTWYIQNLCQISHDPFILPSHPMCYHVQSGCQFPFMSFYGIVIIQSPYGHVVATSQWIFIFIFIFFGLKNGLGRHPFTLGPFEVVGLTHLEKKTYGLDLDFDLDPFVGHEPNKIRYKCEHRAQ